MLFTHFGISGPTTFIVSAHTSFEKIDRSSPFELYFAPFADMTKEMWNTFLLDQGKISPRKQITTILHQHLPQRIVEVINTNIFS